ncbi:MAG: protein kinase [Planctomycetota bacterium]
MPGPWMVETLMWRLQVERGPLKGKNYRLKGSGSVSVGRSSKNGIVIPDEMMSRIHCRLIANGDRLKLEDLGSHNGVQVNHLGVKTCDLANGDLIILGETEISVFLAEQEDPLIGKEIQGYKILERIGRGGGGTVYLAEQTKLLRKVAVKVLAPELSSQPEYVNRFLNEARTAATLTHPHLVGVFDIVHEESTVFFSMEHMQGGSLGELAMTEKVLAPAVVTAHLVQACQGLDYIHKKGFVHRDIKPANLMLDEAGTLKIGDFGIALRSTHGKVERVIGSPHFMSPEQARGLPLDSRSDLYSLGCTAFRLLSGMPPFVGASMEAVLMAHVQQKPPTFRAVKGLSTRVATVLDPLLAKNPDERWGSAGILGEKLGEAMKAPKLARRRIRH